LIQIASKKIANLSQKFSTSTQNSLNPLKIRQAQREAKATNGAAETAEQPRSLRATQGAGEGENAAVSSEDATEEADGEVPGFVVASAAFAVGLQGEGAFVVEFVQLERRSI
jgi:hypothetical protein